MHHGHVAGELVMTCSPVDAVVPRVVEDAVMPGMRAGDDRRVVRERDRRQRRHRAVTERDAHLDEPRDVRRLAPRGHVVEDVGVGAVEEEPDDVLRALARVEHVDERARRPAPRGTCRRRAARSRAAPRSWARCRRAGPPAGSTPSWLHALAADHQRRAGLHDADRAVLAEVAALVLPVVRGRVDHAQVGRGGRVEELGDLLEGERVGVVAAVGVQVRPARRRGRRTCRSTGRRAGSRPRFSTSTKSPRSVRSNATRPSGASAS